MPHCCKHTKTAEQTVLKLFQIVSVLTLLLHLTLVMHVLVSFDRKLLLRLQIFVSQFDVLFWPLGKTAADEIKVLRADYNLRVSGGIFHQKAGRKLKER